MSEVADNEFINLVVEAGGKGAEFRLFRNDGCSPELLAEASATLIRNKYWWIDFIMAKGGHLRQGNGTKLMKFICRWADHNKHALGLYPHPRRGTIPIEKLVSWYQGMGFKMDKNANLKRDPIP